MGRLKYVIMPKFVAIGSNRCRDIVIYHFSIWRPSAILDLLCECSDHPRRVFGGLYCCATFDLNRCSSFDIRLFTILDFTSLAWKCLFTSRNWHFWGFDPLNREACQQNSQKTHPWATRYHIISSKSVHRCDLCPWRKDQKIKKTNLPIAVDLAMAYELQTAGPADVKPWLAKRLYSLVVLL